MAKQKEERNFVSFNDLPNEIISYILSHLKIKDVLNCKLINKYINQIIDEDKLIKNKLLQIIDKHGVVFYDKDNLSDIHNGIFLKIENDSINISYQDPKNSDIIHQFKNINITDKIYKIFISSILDKTIGIICILCNNILYMFQYIYKDAIIGDNIVIYDRKIEISNFDKILFDTSRFLTIEDNTITFYNCLYRDVPHKTNYIINKFLTENTILYDDNYILCIVKNMGFLSLFVKSRGKWSIQYKHPIESLSLETEILQMLNRDNYNILLMSKSEADLITKYSEMIDQYLFNII